MARFQDRELRYPLPRDEASLGSGPANEIVLPFPGVSRRHATVRASGEGCVLRDLDSKNKLIVDGRRLEEVALVPGQSVRVGKATLSLEQGSTSDFDLAFRLDLERRATRDEETHSATDATFAGPAMALRLVRELESLSARGFRRAMPLLLDRARAVLGARSIVVGSRGGDGTAAILAISGSMPEGPLPESKTRGRSPRRSTWAFGVDAIASTHGGQWMLATFGPRPREAWMTDFLDYVAAKCFAGGGDAKDEVVPEGELAIPAGMVVGESAAMRALLREIRATVHSRLDVLLTGETGTGKELCARMIHDSGPTAGGPFVAVNCAAVPAELLESELFGIHARVATGVDPRPGHFVQAHGGTMFLDEVGELPLPLQAKLLRVVQEREVLPLGALAPRKLDIRVIAASNRDLARDVGAGTFRADLFYRLQALHFHLPPLRERRDDIPAMVMMFVACTERAIAGVSRAALAELQQRDWGGNIRELRNEIQRAVLLCERGEALQRRHLRTAAPAAPSEAAVALQVQLDVVEREAIDRALAVTRGNRSRAADLLGITRNGLAMKMRRLGIG